MRSTSAGALRAAALVLMGACAAQTALAAAPMAKTQAPGFYRMTLGDFEITALSDGTVDLPVDKLLHQKADKTNKALARAFVKAPLETSVNAYLINTGSKLVLVDTGAAGLFGPTLGKLAANLQAAGYQPAQVDEIYITHLHPDHAGGLTADGKMAFPNATVRMEKHDADFWLSKVNMEKAPAAQKGYFQNAIGALAPYADVNRMQTFEGNAELAPGIKAVAAFGHTPGHSIYMVESRGQKLALVGDIVHVQAVQFDDPAVTIDFDSDSKAAAVQRKATFAEAAKQGYLIAAAHLPFPGIGRLRATGNTYQFVPVNYSVPR